MHADRVQITEEKLLSDNWYILKRFTFNYLGKNGKWTTQQREAYDRGNGATILLYNSQADTVILTRQFRLPTFVNGNPGGMLIEACAGLLDDEHPDDAIRRETEEETGYRIQSVQKVMEAYMSPGSVTEKLFFYLAHYTADTERVAGGGIDEEEIDILELPVSEAIDMVMRGEIMDGKTIMLLQYLRLQQLTNSLN
ncbi:MULTISPECIES: GDP-mannose pyrophosphatase NudK [unclassified Spirosoma]|uniref:GDP-mannose pyrophosphatase NudK n=1 Tax=unclassified Spirosoma TaxID=2621999 RepID=UPI0009631D79|nr:MULTISPECIES: GDP-mannose pyrophosphatase NudK [unclassified Spirosoma]MBN8826858.1 GDP-mannose pyrophosphatase NudK [Spirosoma sp.]OJW75539.1 MAG: GDP-mannose pyrophosphatase [Spirosoma sp. 48-14]